MIIQGKTYDKNNLQPLPGVTTAIVVNSTSQQVTTPYTSEDETYSAWTNENPYIYSVRFSKPGYETQIIQFIDLEQFPDVYLVRSGTEFSLTTVGIVVAALGLTIASFKKQGKKISGITTGDVIPFIVIGGALIAFDVVNKILIKLGIVDSAATIALDDAATNPNSFWNPNFWKSAPNGQYSYAITESEARQWIRDIKNSFGAFNDNEEQAIAVFKRCRTQANASFLSWVFNKDSGEDLLKYLRGGWWPQDRLSDADVWEITQFVNGLPKY